MRAFGMIPLVICALEVSTGKALAVVQPATRDLEYLTLSWSGAHSEFWSTKQVEHVCTRIADAMTVGNGLWGFGVFKRYGCYLDGSLVAGQAGVGPWVMIFEPDQTSLSVGLYRQQLVAEQLSSYAKPSSLQLETLFEMKLTPAHWLPEFLRNDDLARLVAAPYLLSLPAVTRMSIEDVARGYKTLRPETFDASVAAITPPNRIQVNSLASLGPRQNRLADMGRGVLTSDAEEPWSWRLYDTETRFETTELFVSTVGADDVRAQLKDAVKRIYSQTLRDEDPFVLSAALKGTFDMTSYVSSGQVAPFSVGARYGQDVEGSEVQFGKPVTMVGVVVEARSGLLKGFRAYYDQTPTVVNEETQVEYGARRILLGRTFSLKMPLILDHIDLTPRAGIWDVQSKVLLNDPAKADVQYVLPVAIKRALGIGLEAGAEVTASRFIGRVWGSRDVSSGGQLDRFAGGSVQGTRYGADAMFKLFEIGARRSGNWLTPMAFVLREDVAIQSSESRTFQRGEQTIEFAAATIGYAMTYVGGGVGLIF